MDTSDGRPLDELDPEATHVIPRNRIPKDTERHESTRFSAGGTSSRRETTVFKFRDTHIARSRIYRSQEGVPWAITDLVRKMNDLISSGEVDGKLIGPGDTVQAAVASYFCRGRVHLPQTGPDSPAYATLPYRILVADAGYWTAEPAVPPETLIHFHVPETIGELIPNLDYAARKEVMVSLQLKEATHVTEERLAAEAERAMAAKAAYAVAERDEIAAGFENFQKASAGASACTETQEWRNLVVHLDDVARNEQPSERVKRKMSERHNTDIVDFGFGSFE
jgi:hypothetical protein